MPSLKELYQEFGNGSTWLFVYVREAHPGERFSAHGTYEQKLRQAELFRQDEALPWPVLIDQLEGRVHRAYGLLPNPLFLIDSDGRVAFRGNFAHAPTLRRALEQLVQQHGRGVTAAGEDKKPHMLGASAFGWKALVRGGDRSVRDVVQRMPPLAANLWLGAHMRPLLAPLARRSRPLPAGAKIAMAALIAGAALVLWSRRSSRD